METPFPLPFAQIAFMALHLLLIVIPWAYSEFIHSTPQAAILSFCTIWLYFAMNYTASALEQPFGKYANCLPFEAYRREIQADLCSLLHPGLAHPRTPPAGVKEEDYRDDGNWPHERWETFFRGQKIELLEERGTNDSEVSDKLRGQKSRKTLDEASSLEGVGFMHNGIPLLLHSALMHDELEMVAQSSQPRLAQMVSQLAFKSDHFRIVQ